MTFSWEYPYFQGNAIIDPGRLDGYFVYIESQTRKRPLLNLPMNMSGVGILPARK
ncbi:MAG: hypothetical protein F6K26_17505 [Moorea sp. SIO2I5]|nr:hypothetical protein [Moorena sp. SIO2I5]